jgi:hypothetical protein
MPGYILWYNSASGESQFWFMNRERLARRGTALSELGEAASILPPFRIVGTHLGHILWHHDDTHETQFWFMDQERIVRRGTVLDEDGKAVFIGPPFRIVGLADFNGDGNADILWHHADTHETQMWFMNQERLVRRGTVLGEDGDPVFIGPPFRIVGAADFDGDGKSDILWYNDITGETQIWFMNQERLVRRGTVLSEVGEAALILPPFRIMGTSDSDLNGKGEIVWHHDDIHETQFWFMDSERIVRRGTALSEEGEPVFIAPPFRVVGGGVAESRDRLAADQAIERKFNALGGLAGAPLFLGPQGLIDIAGGFFRDFAHGRIFFNRAIGEEALYVGRARQRYDQLGGPASFLGWPMSDDILDPAEPGSGVTRFQNGAIYWWPDIGSIEMRPVSLRYLGLHCFGETNELSASDEPYVTFGVVPMVTKLGRTLQTRIYEGVDAGESRGDDLELYRVCHSGSRFRLPLPNMTRVILISIRRRLAMWSIKCATG